jgi:hypothetical protein
VVVAPPVEGVEGVVVVGVVVVVVVGVVVVVVGVVVVELSDLRLAEAVLGHCVICVPVPRQMHGFVLNGGQIVLLHTLGVPPWTGAQNLTFDGSVNVFPGWPGHVKPPCAQLG